jgi:hypothetical protein
MFDINNMTQMSYNFKEQSKIRRTERFPLCGGGGLKMATQAISPIPQDAESPAHLAESPPQLAGPMHICQDCTMYWQ